MSLVECRNLSVGYDGKSVQENINFSVEKGDYIYILGENGTGKSTFIKTLLGFVKPVSGEIIYSNELEKNSIGYLPQQNSNNKDFPANVKEIVLSGCQAKTGLFPFYTKDNKVLAKKNMERMQILELENKSFKELSGGQQQRVLLARALCAASQILLLDEPVKGFDPKITEEMYLLIEQLNKDGMTIIMISHDLQAAKKYATKVLEFTRDRSLER